MISPAVDNLVAQLTRLPGIGTRTAQRLAFHILRSPKDEAGALAAAIAEVKERVRFCRECGNLTEDEVCAICLDARRDHSVICVVEQPVDVVSLERTAEYRGLYHVLGGALSPLDGVDPGDLRIDELLRRVEANGVAEVVLATNPNMTGEATAAYLADRLRGRVRVTRLASGLPVGARPRVRGRGHARPRAVRPPRDVTVPEAPLEDSGSGLAPAGEGWFVVNVRDARWATAESSEHKPPGSDCRFESRELPFLQLGVKLRVLEPGQPNGLYHSENQQEDFLVLSGECRLLVEDEERLLRPLLVGLRPLPARDASHLRRPGRRALRDPDGRCTAGRRAPPLPGVGARGPLRGERGRGDD